MYIIRSVKKLFVVIAFVPIIYSCSLSKQQINTCNTYYNNLEEYYKYTNKINEGVANIKFNRQRLLASVQDSILQKMDILDSAIVNYQKEILMPYEVNKTLMKINSYTNAYSFKSSYNTDFLRNFKKFLVEYIPFGIGDIIYEIVFATRKIIIKPNVGKKIKKHVESGNDIIIDNVAYLVLYSEKKTDAMQKEKEVIKKNYHDFILKLKEKPDSWDNYTRLDPIFIEQYHELVTVVHMNEHLIKASQSLEHAQEELYDNTRKRKKIKDQLTALDSFFVEIRYLKKIEMQQKQNPIAH